MKREDKREYLKYLKCYLLSQYQKSSIKKTPNFKPPISHIIIDIRTKKTLDFLEAKNRTNTIARHPAKTKLLDDKSFIVHRRLHPPSRRT